MSISSDSEPPYNEFYDRPAVSEDSVAALIPKAVSGRPAALSARPHEGVFPGILSSFQACCLSRRVQTPAQHAQQEAYIAEVGHLSDESATSEDEPLLDVAPRILQTKEKKRLSETTRALKTMLENHGLNWSDFASTQKLDSTAKWIVTSSIQEACESAWVLLKQEDLEIAALNWCRNLELSDRMNNKLLQQMMSSVAKLHHGYTIALALEKLDEYSFLTHSNDMVNIDLIITMHSVEPRDHKQVQSHRSPQFGVRHVEARLVEEVMGEFQSAVLETSEGGGCIYLIISNIRTVGIYCRKQGDAMALNIFDTGMSRDRGPAFLGFDQPGKVETYLREIYASDPLVKQSSKRFSAWTIKSKHELRGETEEDAIKKGIGVGMALEPAAWDSAKDYTDTTDDMAQANIAYTAMYHATNTTVEEENLFTQTAGGAINVHEKRKK